MSEDQLIYELRQINERIGKFKTEGEIKAIVDDRLVLRTEEQNRLLRQQTEFLSKIADGAQTQMYSSAILHGNAEAGLKGFVPDVLERLDKLEKGSVADRDLDVKRDADILQIKANQGRILSFLHGVGQSLLMDEHGKVDWRKLVGWASGSSVVSHVVLWPRQSWSYAQWIWSWFSHRR